MEGTNFLGFDMNATNPNSSTALGFVIKVLIVIVVLVLIYFLQRKIKQKRMSPEWLEAQKNKETNIKNVANLAKNANLTSTEKALLWDMCHRFKAKNIEFLVKDEDEMNKLLKQEYDVLAAKNNQNEIANFFSLYFKLEKVRFSSTSISTTSSLAEGQEFTYKDADGYEWQLKLISNSSNGLYIEIPKMLASSDKKPAPLAKFILNFTLKGSSSYSLLTRVIRYDQDKQGNSILVASSTNTLKPIQRRMSKRMKADSLCKFSAVKKLEEKKGATDFEILEKKYEGELQDVSSSGCRISCGLPIKQGQSLYIEFEITKGEPLSAIGTIVMTKKSLDGKAFILHIKFVEIDIAVRNKIYAYAYGYLNE